MEYQIFCTKICLQFCVHPFSRTSKCQGDLEGNINEKNTVNENIDGKDIACGEAKKAGLISVFSSLVLVFVSASSLSRVYSELYCKLNQKSVETSMEHDFEGPVFFSDTVSLFWQ